MNATSLEFYSLTSTFCALLPPTSFAFQPIVDIRTRSVIAYEALVRGLSGESANHVLADVPSTLLGGFDEHCRVTAIRQAAQLGISSSLHLNLMPQTVRLGSDCLASTREAARRHMIPLESIVIEITEQEVFGSDDRFLQLCEIYRGSGMRIAFDDFGSGFSGLKLLAEFQPDILKLDQRFSRGITRLGPRQAIARAILQACRDLGIDLIAEGIETLDEFLWFRDEGATLFQGYFFGRPAIGQLPALSPSLVEKQQGTVSSDDFGPS